MGILVYLNEEESPSTAAACRKQQKAEQESSSAERSKSGEACPSSNADPLASGEGALSLPCCHQKGLVGGKACNMASPVTIDISYLSSQLRT